jgi:phage tail-like protein
MTHMFVLELDGDPIGSFQEISGMGIQHEVTEIKEGGLNSHAHKAAGRATYGDISLKKGYRASPAFFGWLEAIARLAHTPRLNGSIVMMDETHSEVCRWNFYRAIPIKWEGPALNSGSSALAVESLTLSVEWIEWAPAGEGPAEAPPPPPPPPPPAEPPIDQTLDGVNFASGSSTVSPDPNPQLDELAQTLEDNPEKNIRVEGHTDSQGGASSNQSLSESRANAVRDNLIASGTDPGRVTAVGYGEDQPIADNNTSSGRAKNRRVDVKEV